MEGRVLSKVKVRTKFPAIPVPPIVAFRSTADETKEPKLLVTEGAASVTLASLYDGLSSHGSFWWHFFWQIGSEVPVPVIRAGPGTSLHLGRHVPLL
jgi:hypothetical protein